MALYHLRPGEKVDLLSAISGAKSAAESSQYAIERAELRQQEWRDVK